jgi:translation elongation factor EF-Tu-like GTPase
MRFFLFSPAMQVLSETGNAKSIAFEEIDKAPEEKARGITISTVCSLSFFFAILFSVHFHL